jgi:hypothetical protein
LRESYTVVPRVSTGADVVLLSVFGRETLRKSDCSISPCFESVSAFELFVIFAGSLYPIPSYRIAPVKYVVFASVQREKSYAFSIK